VGVFVIREEYRQLWVQLAPLLRPGVVAYGFDFNPRESNGFFSLRGSSSHAMLVKVGDAWRYFPARFIAMSDSDFVRSMHPPMLNLRRVARRLIAGGDGGGGGGGGGNGGAAVTAMAPLYVPLVHDEAAAAADATELFRDIAASADDWKRLLSLDVALGARCASSDDTRRLAESVRRTVTFPFGTVRYHEFELIACLAGDFANRSRATQRWTSKFPRTVADAARAMDAQQLLAVLRLRHGVVQSVVPVEEREVRHRIGAYEALRVGAFAPTKKVAVFALVDGNWRLFPRAVFAAAVNVVAVADEADESLSEADFYDSDDEATHGENDDHFNERDTARQAHLKSLVRGGDAYMSYAADAPVLAEAGTFRVENNADNDAEAGWNCVIQ
jgi:hypothetical protein